MARVAEILKSLEREPAKLYLDDNEIVTTSSGEKITYAQSKIRLKNLIESYGLFGSFFATMVRK